MRTPWRRGFAAAAAAVVGLGLAGCTPGSPPPASRPPTPSAPQATTPSTAPAQPTQPSGQAIPPSDAGPSPLPAADKGPMLWLATTTVTVSSEGWTQQQPRYGFVDTTGALVVPPRYDSYEYCRDASGRASLVLAASGEKRADVLDLTGTVVAHLPGRLARCVGDTHAIFSKQASELGPAEYGNGVADLRDGTVILKPKPGRYVLALDARTLNVHDGNGEYFLDLATGKRTPHLGYVTWEAEGQGAGLVPAALRPPGNGESEPAEGEPSTEDEDLMGYLDDSGAWAIEPRFTQAGPFHAGYAVVSEGSGEHFVDTGFQRVGEDWHWINHVGWGYTVLREHGETGLTGLLGLDLRVILEPVDGEADCQWDVDQICAVYPSAGPARLVLLPEGTVTGLPAGFTHALSRTLADDSAPDGSRAATRVHDSRTGTTFGLALPGACTAVGDDWVSCRPEAENLPAEIRTASGDRTGFREIGAVPDATTAGDAPYYWAVAGSYQGLVDSTGSWRYRESRYTNLED